MATSFATSPAPQQGFKASVKNGKVLFVRKADEAPKPAEKVEPPVEEPVDAPRPKVAEKK